jgi:hypothetical protein
MREYRYQHCAIGRACRHKSSATHATLACARFEIKDLVFRVGGQIGMNPSASATWRCASSREANARDSPGCEQRG